MKEPDIDTKKCSGCGKSYKPPILQQDAELCKACHKKTLNEENYNLITKNYNLIIKNVDH